MTGGVVVGPDGVPRCPWATSAPEYVDYHDREWGQVLHGDDALFERLTLEAFQSGLSWLTILRRREGFRRAFAGFSVKAVASYDEHDVARLLDDPGIVRNRAKITAAVTNAQAALALGTGGLDALVWAFAPTRPRPAPRRAGDVPAATPESGALAARLREVGFRFVGPVTAYATMQACGLVDDHLADCAARVR